MRSQYYMLAVIGILLAACSPRVRSVDASSDVVFVPLSEEPKDKRNADRVVIGMSRQQVDAIMGPSVKTCWMYPAGNVRQKVCFSDDKVTSVARTEHVPGTDRALIDATFATDTSISHSVPPDIVAVGASSQHVRRLWGAPPVKEEQYALGGEYWATFENGRVTGFKRIAVPPAFATTAGSRNPRP